MTVRFNNDEYAMLVRLETERGYRRADLFRWGIRDRYNKEFPKYKEPTEETDALKKLSDENYCTKVLGGEVRGAYCIIIKPNGSESKVPLSRVKEETN